MHESANGQSLTAATMAPPRPITPPFPETPDQLDLSLGFVTDLALKTLSTDASATTASISERLKLGLLITETVLQRLYRDNLIEMKGSVALHNNRYAMLERGWSKISQLMNVSSYIGPAPVKLEAYSEMLVNQVRSRQAVTPDSLERTLAHLVLPDSVKRMLGVVVSSGRSLFLSGPPGNGKTAMARALVNAIEEPL